MGRLETAMKRFSAALDRLESVAAARVAAPAALPGTEIAALQAERDALLARLASLGEETRELSGLTEEVEQRLDGAIAEIRAVLSRG